MKRRIGLIGLFLLLGAALNFAIALACALCVHYDMRSRPLIGFIPDSNLPKSVNWVIHRRDAFGATQVFAMPHGSSLAPLDLKSLPSFSGMPETLYERSAVARELPMLFMIDGRGWPFRSLCCRFEFEGARMSPIGLEAAIDFGIRLPPKIPVGRPIPVVMEDNRALPLLPIWRGASANTAIYAALLWALVAGTLALRRRHRNKRGLCPACKYPVGESAICSECGRPVTPNVVASG